MKIDTLSIPDVKLITPKKFNDERGFFCETWSASKLSALGFHEHFVQDNQSLSTQKGTIRGLHCQVAPNIQGKLVRVVKGAIWDVALDIRQGSPTFGQWVAAELSAENFMQLWIPGGFLHGFCTLQDDTEVVYKVTSDYAKDCERAVRWNDPTLAINWPIAKEATCLSQKDQDAPLFNPQNRWFSL